MIEVLVRNEHAERLVFLTDNCGEIVFDMAFIRLLKMQNGQCDFPRRKKKFCRVCTLFRSKKSG
ncbi:MAG: protein-glutamate O-methyltransferase family protein [Lachnospiraceae bacterium]|nr:protein-glutamate O-methyltransferase family protein [Lachnospiraceae bacterium]